MAEKYAFLFPGQGAQAPGMVKDVAESFSSAKKVIDDVSSDIKIDGKNNIFLSLTEETTILSAQLLSEQFDADLYKLIGFDGNEVCQLYLQKGWISELVSLDPEKIGETAIRELLEYGTK